MELPDGWWDNRRYDNGEPRGVPSAGELAVGGIDLTELLTVYAQDPDGVWWWCPWLDFNTASFDTLPKGAHHSDIDYVWGIYDAKPIQFEPSSLVLRALGMMKLAHDGVLLNRDTQEVRPFGWIFTWQRTPTYVLLPTEMWQDQV